MNDQRKYAAPTMELLSLTAEPFMLDEGLDVSDDADHDIATFANTSGKWTPWY